MAIKSKKVDWAKLIVDIQDKLIMSQAEIADHCGVVRQCVSNWKIGYRLPGYHAKRKLLELVEKKTRKEKISDIRSAYQEESTDDPSKVQKTIISLVKDMDATSQKEVLDFVVFKTKQD